MQTFLPYPDFEYTAEFLDRQRLGSQRKEAKQILNALETGRGWIYHPATKMWRGYEYQLCEYGIYICAEWIGRGYVDNLLEEFIERQDRYDDTGMPPWMGDEEFHESHRSKLMMKKPEYYNFPNTRLNLPYIWPVLNGNGGYTKKIGS